MNTKTVLAIDLGAESGRVMAVGLTGDRLTVEELHRFPNLSVTVRGTLYWDFYHLWHQIQAGVERGKALNPASIGVDTWGVDFGLLDRQGNLLGMPVHYRDRRTEGMMDAVFARVPRSEIFNQTGIQFLSLNTLYQLYSCVVNRSPHLEMAETLLMAPDLIHYWLTGEKVSEFTIATTTQFYDPRQGDWARSILERLEIPAHMLPPVVQPGTRLGNYDGIPVIAPASHDTGSAVVAMPTATPNYGYISSGTWSLVGLEIAEPLISDAALAVNATNEGGVNGTYRLLRNVAGMWFVQQCRATWRQQGHSYDYAQLAAIAEEAAPLRAFIDPNDPRFLPAGDFPSRIQAYCAETGQPIPQSHGEILRCALESLALASRDTLTNLMELTGRAVEIIHIVGGGSQNQLFCQMIADATGIPVQSGPVEATVIGNALVQLISLGEIANLHEARQLVSAMPGGHIYHPQSTAEWDQAYQVYKQLC
jgi:rhamnulokinase